MNPKELLLGVDIGTTTVSAQVIGAADGRVVRTYTVEHQAFLEDEVYKSSFILDAEKLCEIAAAIIREACSAYPAIKAIGLTGQMHGIVCLGAEGQILSPLYSWQNQFGEYRVSGTKICDEIKNICGHAFPTGYGLVTVYALKRLGLYPKETRKIACISDLVMMRLCGKAQAVCHPTNAHAFGFYDLEQRAFDIESLAKLGISREILPEISKDYGVYGFWGKVPISYSIGDNQAAAFGTMCGDEVLLNIGTSAQVGVLCEAPVASTNCKNLACEVRPYFGKKVLCSGAVLCGGRAIAVLADFIAEIAGEFGNKPSKAEVYRVMEAAAVKSQNVLQVSSAFSGTRSHPEAKGYIANIGIHDLTMSEVCGGIYAGVIEECYDLYKEMTSIIPNVLVVSGNALRNSSVLRKNAERIFGVSAKLPVHTEEAAYGAALYGGISAGILNEEKACELIHYKEDWEI